MNKENPRISILVPIFNVEKYLNECLNSIINQTLKNIEIICINDGSTDNSLNIIKSFMKKDPRINLINKSNSGYGDSMNLGLKLATGEYIGIVESDDIAKKNMFESLYKQATKYNFPDIIKSNYYEYWAKNNGKKIKLNLPKNSYKKVFLPKENQEIFKSLPSIWAAIYKKDFIINNSIYFNPTPGASYQDTGFNFKILTLAKTMVCVKKAYLIYRRDNESSSVNNREKVFCICDEFQLIETFLKTNPYLQKSLKPIETSIKFSTYLRNYHRISIDYKKEFLKFVKNELKKEKEEGWIKKEKFTSSEWTLLKALLDDNFEEVLKKQHKKYLDFYIKKLNLKLKTINTKKHIILYGFNDLAKELYKTVINKFDNIEIIDKNKAGNSYKNTQIKSIEETLLSQDKIIVICTINEIFIKEIKKTILNMNKDIQIISL